MHIVRRYREYIGIFYDCNENYFIDENGEIIYDIFSVISPDSLFLFKSKKKNLVVPCSIDPTTGVEIYFPDEEYRLSMVDNI